MELDYRTRIGVEQTTKIEGLVSKTGPGSFSSSEADRRQSLPLPLVAACSTARLHHSSRLSAHDLPREAFSHEGMERVNAEGFRTRWEHWGPASLRTQ